MGLTSAEYAEVAYDFWLLVEILLRMMNHKQIKISVYEKMVNM
jgi:hypothetical protein